MGSYNHIKVDSHIFTWVKVNFGIYKDGGIYFTLLRLVKSFQYFIVPQLFRCTALSEGVTSAGLIKGIDAPVRRSSYFE